MSVLLRVAYDGTDFCGFARQGGGLRTVQGDLDFALSELFGCAIEVRGASRTDAGVHAESQLVAFDVPPAGKGPPTERIIAALRGVMAPDVAVWKAWDETRPDGSPAQPRFDNGGKTYRYRVRDGAEVREPATRRFEWTLRRTLDIDAMTRACAVLRGRKNFASFQAAGCSAKSTERNITAVDLSLANERTAVAGGEQRRVIEVVVRGEAFLMHMVRIMVGTLVEVGSARLTLDDVRRLFDDPDRRRAGQTAPAHGLTLVDVVWPGSWRKAPELESGRR